MQGVLAVAMLGSLILPPRLELPQTPELEDILEGLFRALLKIRLDSLFSIYNSFRRKIFYF